MKAVLALVVLVACGCATGEAPPVGDDDDDDLPPDAHVTIDAPWWNPDAARADAPGAPADAPPPHLDAPAIDGPPGAADGPPVVTPDGPPVVTPDAPPVVTPDAPPVVTPDAPPVVTPDAPPPCTPTWVDVLANGAFDLGAVSWTEYSLGGYAITTLYTDVPALTVQTAPYLAYQGGYYDGHDQIYQTVTIPAGATALHLKGYRWIGTEETGSTAYDFLYAGLLTTGGAVIQVLATLSNADSSTGWVAFDYTAATPHAGETLQVMFEATTDFSLNTNFFLDTVSLEALVCI